MRLMTYNELQDANRLVETSYKLAVTYAQQEQRNHDGSSINRMFIEIHNWRMSQMMNRKKFHTDGTVSDYPKPSYIGAF